MKKVNIFSIGLFIMLAVVLSSCEAIAGIFKAGMGFGIFMIIAIVALVIFFVMRVGKNKS